MEPSHSRVGAKPAGHDDSRAAATSLGYSSSAIAHVSLEGNMLAMVGGRPARIMVVEDNVDSLMLLCYLLKRKGYDVFSAKTVERAIEVGRQKPFDILICDIGLPDGEGGEVLRELRKHRQFPAIALTAHATSRDIEQQIEEGFDLHISKPFRASYLDQAIRKLVERTN